MSKKSKKGPRRPTFSQIVFGAIAILVIASFVLTLVA